MKGPVAPSEALVALHGKTIVLCILLVALLLRLGMVLTSDTTNYPDFHDFLHHANGIIEGHYPDRSIEAVYSFRAPLYPFLLSVFIRLFGERFILVTLFQAITGVALVYVIYLFGRRLFNEQAGLISAALASVYPYLIHPIGHIQTESLFTLLIFTGTVWFTEAVGADRKEGGKHLRWAVGAGLLLGLAILCRPSAMLMILILGVWVVGMASLRIREWRALTRPYLILLVSAGFVVLPWTVRNYIRFSELILVNNQAGEIFWYGNSPHYLERYRVTTREEFGAIGRKQAEEAKADEAFVSHLTPGELDRYYWKKGWSYVSSSPREWVYLLFLKWVAFWRPWVNPVAYGWGTVLLSAVFSVPVFLAGGIGLVQLFRTGRYRYFALLLAIFVVHSVFFTLFHPAVRYRTPTVDVYLLVLAGGGLRFLVTWWGGKDKSLRRGTGGWSCRE